MSRFHYAGISSETEAPAVLDIACERDGAAELLRGRTFARVLH